MAKRILVVEDTAHLRENILELLSMEGYSVSSAQHGREGLSLLQESMPDLIITDLRMPEMDGFDFIARVRENKLWNGIPILVFSAMPPHENEKIILRLGANAYLKKPSALEDLVTAVKKLIDDE